MRKTRVHPMVLENNFAVCKSSLKIKIHGKKRLTRKRFCMANFHVETVGTAASVQNGTVCFNFELFIVGLVAVAAFLRCSSASADFACASTSASSARLFAALFCRNCLNVIMVVSCAVTQVFMGFEHDPRCGMKIKSFNFALLR